MPDPIADPAPVYQDVGVDAWAEYIGEWARSKGWYASDKLDQMPKIAGRNSAELLALITSEISEALEEARLGRMDTYFDEHGKPQGFFSELADAFIRIADLFDAAGKSLNQEVVFKMSYNKHREYRHGGKLG